MPILPLVMGKAPGLDWRLSIAWVSIRLGANSLDCFQRRRCQVVFLGDLGASDGCQPLDAAFQKHSLQVEGVIKCV